MKSKEAVTEVAAAVAEKNETEVVAKSMVEEAGERTVPREKVSATSVGTTETTWILSMFPFSTTPPDEYNLLSNLNKAQLTD